jgi:hypothetical protein
MGERAYTALMWKWEARSAARVAELKVYSQQHVSMLFFARGQYSLPFFCWQQHVCIFFPVSEHLNPCGLLPTTDSAASDNKAAVDSMKRRIAPPI